MGTKMFNESQLPNLLFCPIPTHFSHHLDIVNTAFSTAMSIHCISRVVSGEKNKKDIGNYLSGERDKNGEQKLGGGVKG